MDYLPFEILLEIVNNGDYTTFHDLAVSYPRFARGLTSKIISEYVDKYTEHHTINQNMGFNNIVRTLSYTTLCEKIDGVIESVYPSTNGPIKSCVYEFSCGIMLKNYDIQYILCGSTKCCAECEFGFCVSLYPSVYGCDEQTRCYRTNCACLCFNSLILSRDDVIKAATFHNYEELKNGKQHKLYHEYTRNRHRATPIKMCCYAPKYNDPIRQKINYPPIDVFHTKYANFLRNTQGHSACENDLFFGIGMLEGVFPDNEIDEYIEKLHKKSKKLNMLSMVQKSRW